MNAESMFDVTGTAARAGVIATALMALACDVEASDPGARVRAAEVQDLELEDADAAQPTDSEAPSSAPCDRAAHPSVHVVPALLQGDYFAPVDVDMVWFEHDGQTFEARCLEDDEGNCTAWMAGYELSGPITVSTEYCETVVTETVDVGMEDNGCHVRTEYMMLQLSTRGCLTSELPPTPPPPRWPFDLTSAGGTTQHPGHGDPGPSVHGATDLTTRPDSPPPPPSDEMVNDG